MSPVRKVLEGYTLHVEGGNQGEILGRKFPTDDWECTFIIGGVNGRKTATRKTSC